MKRKIGFISLDSSLLQWMYEKMRTTAPDTAGKEDFVEGLEELMTGKVRSLMIELESEEEVIPSNRILQCGELSIDPKFRKVVRDHREISLTPKEFDILYFLARNRGEVFTKEQIYQAVWEKDYLLDDSNIMAFVRKLRKKIEPNPDAPEYIQTIWGVGYKFNDAI